MIKELQNRINQLEERIRELPNSIALEVEKRLANYSDVIKNNKGITSNGDVIFNKSIRIPLFEEDPTPIVGGLYFNTKLKRLKVCQDGANWVNIWTD